MVNDVTWGLWRHQQWSPSWILSRIRNQAETAINDDFFVLDMKNNTLISTLHDYSHKVYFYCWKKKKHILSLRNAGVSLFLLLCRSCLFLFLWRDEILYNEPYFDLKIFIDLWNERQSEGMHGNLRVNGFSLSCSDIFCIHEISPTLYHSNFCLASNGKERCVTIQNGCMGTNSLRGQPIIVSSRNLPQHKEA